MQDESYRDRCWEWPGARAATGYGYFKSTLAHRVFYEMAKGPIPDDLIVRHRCDNPICVNPSHLELGTLMDNVRDMDQRGRRATGARHGRAKLDPDKVRTIRADYANGSRGPTALARDYGVSMATIYDVVNRKHWADVA